MRVEVESCWNGKSSYYQITFPYLSKKVRERINKENWNRKAATEALDLLEKVYGLNRKNVRFKT